MDVVWNQTSSTIYKETTKYRYHEERVADSTTFYPQKILSRLWESAGLPDLKTELFEIREEGYQAVQKYRRCGGGLWGLDRWKIF